MNKIEINECVYYIHPVYDLYASDKDGYVINIIKKVPHVGNKNNSGYMRCGVRKHGQNGFKKYQVHRFVWECFNGLIMDDKVIDHINDIKDDNRLCSLQLVTQSENTLKSTKNRDFSFVANNRKNKKCVRATNITTKEVLYFNSIYAVQQHLNVDHGTIRRVCEGINNYKSGRSKKDGCSYKFEYVKKEDLPDDYIKSTNRSKMSDEHKKKHHAQAMNKWQNKDYKCPRCDNVMKNNNRQYHRKICN